MTFQHWMCTRSSSFSDPHAGLLLRLRNGDVVMSGVVVSVSDHRPNVHPFLSHITCTVASRITLWLLSNQAELKFHGRISTTAC